MARKRAMAKRRTGGPQAPAGKKPLVIILDEDLIDDAKVAAINDKTKVSAVVEKLLRSGWTGGIQARKAGLRHRGGRRFDPRSGRGSGEPVCNSRVKALYQPWTTQTDLEEDAMTFRLKVPDPKLTEAVTLLAEKLDPRAIILFGSRARGTHRPDSDYDLLVVSRQLRDYDEVYEPISGRGIACDVVPCTAEAWKAADQDAGGVLRAAIDEGILLYGQT